jgi:hypothetical protein
MQYYLWTWRGHLPLDGAACRRTRIRAFFSAMDKITGVKRKNCLLRLVSPKITLQLAALIAGCFSILVPELYPQYKEGKATRLVTS